MGQSRNDSCGQTIPGPGAYEETVHSLGRQFESAVASAPEAKIGTDSRFKVGARQ
jgi:hypothetical protein